MPIGRIKQRNHIDSDQIYHMKFIVIPQPTILPEKKEQTENMIIEEFMARMDYGVSYA